MWSKTATFACLSLIISGSTLLTATSAEAAPAESLARAEKLNKLLIRQGILKDTVITWEGTEYDVSKNYQLCDEYNGICYKAVEAGFVEPVMLAIYEIGPDEVTIQQVDYSKYRKDRSNDALKYYMQATGKPEGSVFQMRTGDGQQMFDAQGQLTKAGDAAFESILRGITEDGTVDKAAKEDDKDKKKKKKGGGLFKKKGKSTAKFSKYSVKELAYMGYKEIFEDELDCLHQMNFSDNEMMLEKVLGTDAVRLFMHPKDPSYNVAMKFRRERECKPYGEIRSR